MVTVAYSMTNYCLSLKGHVHWGLQGDNHEIIFKINLEDIV